MNYSFPYMTNALLNNNCIPIRSKADMDFDSDQRSFIYQSIHDAQYQSLVVIIVTLYVLNTRFDAVYTGIQVSRDAQYQSIVVIIIIEQNITQTLLTYTSICTSLNTIHKTT